MTPNEAMSGVRWEHFAHDADMGVRGWGPTPALAFAQAAIALTAVVTDPACVQPRAQVRISCAAPDLELLLADWLNAVVYEMATRRMLFGRFEIQICDNRLQASAWGEPVVAAQHGPAVEVKGATYTSLKVGQTPNGEWFAQCVVDV